MRPLWQRLGATVAGLVLALVAVIAPAVLAARLAHDSCPADIPSAWC